MKIIEHSYTVPNSERKLTKEEFDLIVELLKDKPNTQHIIDELPNRTVEEMNDGGMGSLRFLPLIDKERKFGEVIAEISLVDIDKIPVSFAVYADEDGDIYELDVFKGDFSPLVQFPLPPYIKP